MITYSECISDTFLQIASKVKRHGFGERGHRHVRRGAAVQSHHNTLHHVGISHTQPIVQYVPEVVSVKYQQTVNNGERSSNFLFFFCTICKTMSAFIR